MSKLHAGTFVWLAKEVKLAIVYGDIHKVSPDKHGTIYIDLAFDGKVNRWMIRPNGTGIDRQPLLFSVSYLPEEFFEVESEQDVREQINFLKTKIEHLQASVDVKDILT